jgi:hypothetical protein
MQREESSTTGCFPVVQIDTSQKPYVPFGNVPGDAPCMGNSPYNEYELSGGLVIHT